MRATPSKGRSPAALSPNFPNPFNSTTQIAYRLATPGPVRLVIYNAMGQPVQTLVDQVQTAGWYRVTWNARDQRGVAVSAGVYLTCLHYPGGVTDAAFASSQVALRCDPQPARRH